MKALVTGHKGFIGRHIYKELMSRGYQTFGCDIAEAPGSGYSAQEFFDNDLTVYDLVVHCAYHVGGRAAIDGTNTNFAKNLQLDAGLFEWAVRTKQKRVLYFSSSAAYPRWVQGKGDYGGNPYELPWVLKEDMINLQRGTWQGYDMPDANYGWAKLTGERLAEDARNNGLAVSVVRPFSGYGEDQSQDYPFPSIVARAAQGDLSVWGPKGQTRDWIHVDDVCKGALAVVEAETEEPVNLCTGRGVEMGELALMINHLADREQFLSPSSVKTLADVTYDESKPTGVFYRVGDPTRLHQYYVPKVTLEEGIQKALAVLR